ncbi:MAG: 2-isopropylmalate synthase [Holophagales bacterium]|nr:2-isopropylmalate synthase [Holophagales bacterium]
MSTYSGTSGGDSESPHPPAAPGRDGHVRIFDTTLRDGEQSPGTSLTSREKVMLAHELSALGADVIEAGFPAASRDDAEAVARVAREVGREARERDQPPIICGLARALPADIEASFEAVRHADRPRIHTFLATSDLHLEHKLRMSRQEVVDRVGERVARAASLCGDVEFSPEDAGRSDREFLVLVLGVAIEAGAATLNIPDTVGYLLPQEYGDLIAYLIAHVPGAEQVVWSAHCHDDLGLATANTLAGLAAGARQVEVTVNGIGERAGNTSLEEVVMALETRRAAMGLSTGIDTRQLTRISGLVSHHTGMVVPPNKAIVGRNAFAHEAGIHQDGMLKDQRTYEIMTPESVGRTVSRLVLGKHSGQHAFRVRLEELGFRLEGEDLTRAFRRFKDLADRKKHLGDGDLRTIAEDGARPEADGFHLLEMQVSCARPGSPTATVRLRTPEGEEKVAPAVGTGSVDAVFRAIQSVARVPAVLSEYRVHNLDDGIEALGEVSVHLATHAGARRTYGGYGTDTDVLVASAKAYVDALNRLLADRRPNPSRPAVTPADLAVGPVDPFGGLDETFDPSYTLGIP